MDETLSVGLYNYRILDVKSLNRICKKIENAISVFNIYPYFENTTNVLNVDNRNTFERMLLDYKVSYICLLYTSNKMLNKYIEQLNEKKLHPHTLRHDFATTRYEEGYSDMRLKKSLGQTSNAVNRYVHPGGEENRNN